MFPSVLVLRRERASGRTGTCSGSQGPSRDDGAISCEPSGLLSQLGFERCGPLHCVVRLALPTSATSMWRVAAPQGR